MTSSLDFNRASRILVLAGPPGAGKTTVAPLIAASLGRDSVCLETDWFWTTIVRGRTDPWLREADAQNRTMIRAAASAAAALAEGGYDCVVEGVIGPWMLDELTSAIGSDQPIDYIVLRPDLATCLERAAGRNEVARISGHPPLQDPEPIRALWGQFADLGPYAHHVVDTTAVDAKEAARIALLKLPTGCFSLTPLAPGL